MSTEHETDKAVPEVDPNESEVKPQARVVDGSLNNLDLQDHITLLNSNINSDPNSSENRNANKR